MNATKLRPLIVSLMCVAVLLIAAGIAALMILTRPRPPIKPAPDRAPLVIAPEIQPMQNYRVELVGYGSVRPKVLLQIRPQVSGKVVERSDSFLSGKAVRAGQMLMRIEQTDYRLARDSAKAKVELLAQELKLLEQELANLKTTEKIEQSMVKLAEKHFANVRQLVDEGAGAERDVDQAEELLLSSRRRLQDVLNRIALVGPQTGKRNAEKRIAEVQLEQAETQFKRTTITSEVNGRSLGCEVEIGELVQAGGVCGEVYGTDRMEVPVSISAGDLDWLDVNLLLADQADPNGNKANQIPALVEWQEQGNGQFHRWAAHVERMEAGLEATTRMARLVVQVRNDQLKAGAKPLDINMFCKVTILGNQLGEVFLVPRASVQPDGTVFVVEDGRLARREVKVARMSDSDAMILPDSGLKTGDRVILGAVHKPVIGMKVKLLMTTAPKRADPAAPATSTAPTAESQELAK